MTLPTVHHSSRLGYPFTKAAVQHTAIGTPYLQEPGVVMIAAPQTDISGMQDYLAQYGLGFEDYLNDPHQLSGLEALTKTCGQVCYCSHGPKRTMNDKADHYFDRLMASGHGSVFEHGNVSLHVHGVTRTLTHELIRHRHFAVSQLSQRYVNDSVLRFVEQALFVLIGDLHQAFLKRIDRSAREYAAITKRLLGEQQLLEGFMQGSSKTDQRKLVQQTARAALTQDVETTLVLSTNIRAWRHFITMRASAHADTEIRRFAVYVYLVLNDYAPTFFADMDLVTLADGTQAITTNYQKI